MSEPLPSLGIEEVTMTTMQARRGSTLIALGDDRWRVVEGDGRVRGLIVRVEAPSGTRYRALRFHVPSRAFRAVGEFWSRGEAADTLRLSR